MVIEVGVQISFYGNEKKYEFLGQVETVSQDLWLSNLTIVDRVLETSFISKATFNQIKSL